MAAVTQADRLLRYLLANPGASSLEVTMALGVVNVTGRVSDLRAAGHAIEAKRDARGVYRYRVVRPVQLTLGGREEAIA